MCTSRLCTIIPVHEHAIKKELSSFLGNDQYLAGKIRCDDHHEKIGRASSVIQLKYSRLASVRISSLDAGEKDVISMAEQLNLLPFHNKLYSLFELTREWKNVWTT